MMLSLARYDDVTHGVAWGHAWHDMMSRVAQHDVIMSFLAQRHIRPGIAYDSIMSRPGSHQVLPGMTPCRARCDIILVPQWATFNLSFCFSPGGGRAQQKSKGNVFESFVFFNFIVITGIGDKERDEEQNQEEGEEQDKKLKEQNNEDEEQDEEQNKERTRRRRTRNRTEEKDGGEGRGTEREGKDIKNALQRLPQHVRKTQGVSVPFAPSLTVWCHAVFAALIEHFFTSQF